MTPGEIHLGRFPLGGTPGVKLRPVLVLSGPLGSVPEIVAAYITSVIPPVLMTSDVLLDPALDEFTSTNLKQPSLLRLHKLATLHSRDFIRFIGTLDPATMTRVQTVLRTVLTL